MTAEIEVPLDRLSFFKRHLGIEQGLLEPLVPYAEHFAAQKDEMADFLYDLMADLAQAQIVLHHQTSEERLKHNWKGWYKRFWTFPDSEEFLKALWRSGYRHVAHGVDHRFINLAYSQVRRFTARLIDKQVPKKKQVAVHDAADRLFDLCLLVESDAFIQKSNRCEWDVMSGVAHQLRNPLTVIGGNASRLGRRFPRGSVEHDASTAIFEEALRMERLVKNVSVYLEIQNRDPVFQTVDLTEAIDQVLSDLEAKNRTIPCELSLHLDPSFSTVEADQSMLSQLVSHILENAFEAMAAGENEQPKLTLRTGPSEAGPTFVRLSVFNTGDLPHSLDPEELFLPFHTANPMGTGFGLPTARLAARKNFGTIDLERKSGGTLTEVIFLKPGCLDKSRLFFKTCTGH